LLLVSRAFFVLAWAALAGGLITAVVQLSRTDGYGNDVAGRGFLAVEALVVTVVVFVILLAVAESIRLALALERLADSAASSLRAMATSAAIESIESDS
jgi:hypothetical protein